MNPALPRQRDERKKGPVEVKPQQGLKIKSMIRIKKRGRAG